MGSLWLPVHPRRTHVTRRRSRVHESHATSWHGRIRTRVPASAVADPCTGCDDPRMVEYGGGINNGPAGQVGGGGGQELGNGDIFSRVGSAIDATANTIAAWPPEMLVAAIVIFFVGLIVLTRAF